MIAGLKEEHGKHKLEKSGMRVSSRNSSVEIWVTNSIF